MKYTDPDGRSEVPKIYQNCSAEEKVKYYLNQYIDINEKISKLTNQISTLENKKSELFSKRKEAYKDAFSLLFETAYSAIQIFSTDTNNVFDISVQDAAETIADLDLDTYKNNSFSQLIKDDMDYLEQQFDIDIKIYDKKRELRDANKQKSEIVNYLCKAIELYYKQQENDK